MIRSFLALWLAVVAFSSPVQAQFFDGGWTLQPSSRLNFQSVKKLTVVESSSFATLTGDINENGLATVRVLLDSVDTKVDLRNVRMRFLFFETFKYPEAVITAQINPADLADLEQVRRKSMTMDYTIDLHGVTQTYTAEVVTTLLSNDMVSVASSTPVSIGVSEFNLMEGLEKLQEAASVDVVPSATISFDFVFARGAGATTTTAAAAPAKAASVALEAQGNFDSEACKGRFEILSRTGNIYFASGSARLQDESAPLLNSLADIIARCPGMVVEAGGHTDSIGDSASNQRLSQARAQSVVTFLLAKGLKNDSIVSQGYGETSPIASNDTAEGRWKNRRIEFKVLEN